MELRKSYKTADVFTPSSSAKLTFVDRYIIYNRLLIAINTPGRQVIIYGPTGTGKTTLIERTLETLYPKHIRITCTANLGFDELLHLVFVNLDKHREKNSSQSKSTRFSPSVEFNLALVKGKIEAQFSKENTIAEKYSISSEEFAQILADYLGQEHCCLVLDDFHLLQTAVKETVAATMKVFTDLADTYSDLKIIVIGTVNTAREVLDYNPTMRNRISEFRIPAMTERELRRIIEKGEELLNIRFADDVKNRIVHYSNGVPSVCHDLCLYTCCSADVRETLQEPQTIKGHFLRMALDDYIHANEFVIKSVFEKALRRLSDEAFRDHRLLLKALVQCAKEGADIGTIHNESVKVQASFPRGRLERALRQLQEIDHGEIIRFDPLTHKYFFSDPIYYAFASVSFDIEKQDEEEEFEFDIEEYRDALKVRVEQILNTTPTMIPLTFTEAIMRHGKKTAESKQDIDEDEDDGLLPPED